MPGFNGTGHRGMGPMTGVGRGYCVVPLSDSKTELDFLKNQARALREQLERIEATIKKQEALRAKSAERS